MHMHGPHVSVTRRYIISNGSDGFKHHITHATKERKREREREGEREREKERGYSWSSSSTTVSKVGSWWRKITRNIFIYKICLFQKGVLKSMFATKAGVTFYVIVVKGLFKFWPVDEAKGKGNVCTHDKQHSNFEPSVGLLTITSNVEKDQFKTLISLHTRKDEKRYVKMMARAIEPVNVAFLLTDRTYIYGVLSRSCRAKLQKQKKYYT
jgi:hypothetical protein